MLLYCIVFGLLNTYQQCLWLILRMYIRIMVKFILDNILIDIEF